jgi:hypothetical protein
MPWGRDVCGCLPAVPQFVAATSRSLWRATETVRVCFRPATETVFAASRASRARDGGFGSLAGETGADVRFSPSESPAGGEWAGLDSNQGPTDYESAALTAELPALGAS